jgi:hypothetical protein|tara:strand:+ start:252 stop:509 length:258 start_codon:yes stop_codon:yes gene_type:complete
MNKNQVDDWRAFSQSRLEELTVMNAKQSGEISHIKEAVDEIRSLVKEQNGRVRTLEQQTSAIKATGSVIAVVFSGFIGWLFNIRN